MAIEQTAADVTPAIAATSPLSNSGYFGQVMLGLLMVLAVIFAIAWILRRFGQGAMLANGSMKVVGSLALGTRERMVLVDVGGQQLLLGVAPGRVSTLHVFDEPLPNVQTRNFSNVVGMNTDFASKIRDAMAGRASAQAGNTENNGS